MSNARDPERIQTVVIGAGQAGLSVGYHLARRGLSFVILDANARVGDNWRKRWDSLRLFTPARTTDSPAWPFLAHQPPSRRKTRWLTSSRRMPPGSTSQIRSGVKVERLSRHGRGYLVSAGNQTIEADHVVVAMSNYQSPRVPPFSKDLDPAIRQIHSIDYRNPSQLQEGAVSFVGAGNSGAEIAIEAARGHQVWMSGRDTGQVPFRLSSLIGRTILVRVVLRGLFHHVLTVDTPMGRKVRPKVLSKGGPLIRTRSRDLAAAGVERIPRVSWVKDGRPVLEDGRALDPETSSGARGSIPASPGSTFPCSTRTADQSRSEAWLSISQGCIS